MDEYGTFGTLYSHLLFCFDYPRYEYDLGPHSGHERWLSKNTMMMVGELLGVALVAVSAVVGIAAVMLRYPDIFTLFKIVGASYLVYLGVQMWRSRGKLAINIEQENTYQGSDWGLLVQGFVTAIANPKGWAFMVSLLPPFIDQSLSLAPQLTVLVAIILLSEFISMSLYATGGKGLKRLLSQAHHVRLLNRIAGSLMAGVGIWLYFS